MVQYGLKVLRPQAIAKLELEPTTWRHRWHAFKNGATDAALLALVVLCFSYVFWSFN